MSRQEPWSKFGLSAWVDDDVMPEGGVMPYAAAFARLITDGQSLSQKTVNIATFRNQQAIDMTNFRAYNTQAGSS